MHQYMYFQVFSLFGCLDLRFFAVFLQKIKTVRSASINRKFWCSLFFIAGEHGSRALRELYAAPRLSVRQEVTRNLKSVSYSYATQLFCRVI